MKQKSTIAFIGAGNMAHSLIGGLIADGYPNQNLWASNIESAPLANLKNNFQIHITESNLIAAENANILVLCVKPDKVKEIVLELAPLIISQHLLIISIAAGIRASSISQWLNGYQAIVRAMPNTPALVRSGVAGLYTFGSVTQKERDAAESILRAVGTCLWFDHEHELDIVTAISGSGPAYFFLVMEAIAKAGVTLGLSTKEAWHLTVQTALGAARMALESGKELSELRQRVTSKGGTTEQAIQVLEQGQMVKLFETAILAAKKRSEELAESLG